MHISLLISLVVFFLLGLTLIVSMAKKKVGGSQGSLKRFLSLTGASAVGLFVFVLLHNAVYGVFGVEEPFFFLLAVIVCPLAFLLGATGTIVLFLTKGKRQWEDF